MAQYTDPWLYTSEREYQFNLPLETDNDLDPLMERIGEAHYVLLGEASHGTHEFYTWRTAISKRLIEEKGFNFIAVEGDWPDCYHINRFIKNYDDAGKKIIDVLKDFNRWPTWMWANWEVAALAEWLRSYNARQAIEDKAGFYGLDVYSLWESMDAMMQYLKENDPESAQIVQHAVQCFNPYQEDPEKYAIAASKLSNSCREKLMTLLKEIKAKAPTYDHDREAPLNLEQNAQIAVNAEKYYQAMMSFGLNSWNIRDEHMVETLNRLMEFHGPGAKAIVWEHNTHIGDARATSMRNQGMLNVGQLVREQQKEDHVVLVGFGTHRGSVIAGDSWGAAMKKMTVPPAQPGSIEEILHAEGAENKLLIFDPKNKKERFNQVYPHRAIGVVYHPDRESGNYVLSNMAQRYDAFLFIDSTRALHPLHLQPDGNATYPFSF